MKILYLCLQPPFDPALVATGNQVRAAGIRKELVDAGNTVIDCFPQQEAPHDNKGFRVSSKEQLNEYIRIQQPDAILVAYWSLLDLLPATDVPVILDFIAPRLLEAMFQEEGALLYESQQILKVLARADHFLLGNERQADLLLPLLLLCGIDCRYQIPISVVPISVSGTAAAYNPPESEILLLNAGVEWPWRQSGDYFKVMEAWCSQNSSFDFQNLTGSYPGSDKASSLLGYQQMQRSICASHVGLELSSQNTEREFSHSFRLIEYLQCGLPVIANTWLPVAALIEEYDAGWLVAKPEDLLAVLQSIKDDPAILARKASGSRKLGEEKLNYKNACQPLLRYLAKPWRPAKSVSALKLDDLRATNNAAPAKLKRRRKWLSALVQIYRVLCCRKRPASTPDVVMVTRGDLFPTTHGAAVKIIRTAEAISRHQRRVYLCTDNRAEYYCFENGELTTQFYPAWLRLMALPKKLALLRLFVKGFPWSNAFLYLPLTDFSYGIRALYLATRFPAGSCIADFPAYVKPCQLVRKVLGGRVILVEHNVEYERLKEQIKSLSDESYQMLKDTELTLCSVSDTVITVSDNDKISLLRDGVDPRKVHTIPHGVDLTAFRNTPVLDVRKQYGISQGALLLVYHGPYSYAPNLQAMTVMAKELLPRLSQLGLTVSVLAIGSSPPTETLHPNIIFTGSVHNLAEVIPAADMAVVPLLEGGGTRMKILDYFAAGVPVISTQKGIEGINVTHGREALIVDDFDGICDAIQELANDDQKCRGLISNASTFVSGYSWDAIAERYLPFLYEGE